jgi:hypothetical protein
MNKLVRIGARNAPSALDDMYRRYFEEFELLKNSVASSGLDGLIGLLAALISRYPLSRTHLLSFGRRYCFPNHHAILRELLDFFQGDDPTRHRWSLRADGTYVLLA